MYVERGCQDKNPDFVVKLLEARSFGLPGKVVDTCKTRLMPQLMNIRLHRCNMYNLCSLTAPTIPHCIYFKQLVAFASNLGVHALVNYEQPNQRGVDCK